MNCLSARLVLGVIFFTPRIVEVFSTSKKLEELGQCIGKHEIPLRGIEDLALANEIRDAVELGNFNATPSETILENNGYSIVINLKYNRTVPTVNFGRSSGLATYRFEFLYFQWLENSSTSLPLELHAVFYNTQFKELEDALRSKNNVVVLAFGLQVTHPQATSYAVLRRYILSVRTGLTNISIANRPLSVWLPASLGEYILYEGYLPFFNCNAQVLWVDFAATIAMEPELLEDFQLLRTDKGQPLMKQYTPFLAPTGPLLVCYGISGEVGSMSGIPFVDAYYQDGGANGAFHIWMDIKEVCVLMMLLKFY